jgi:type II secretory pathway pseudopilin PulG
VNTRRQSRFPAAGYTLLEILVVCSVAGIMSAQLMPLLGSARERARRLSCSNNLKHLGLAMQFYHETYKRLPANGLYFWTRQSRNGYTWNKASTGSPFVKLLPFMEQNPIYSKLDFKLAGPTEDQQFEFQKHRSGKLVRSLIMPYFLCPSADLEPHLNGTNQARDPAIACYSTSIGTSSMPSRQSWCTDYPGNTFGTGPAEHGNDARAYRISGAFARGAWAARMRDITDGTAQVIAMGETLPNKSFHQRLGWMSFNGNWTATVAPMNYPTIALGEPGYPGKKDCRHTGNWQTSNGFRSRHPGGVQFVFNDGSVHLLSELIDYHTYQRLGDRRDGQPIGDWDSFNLSR